MFRPLITKNPNITDKKISDVVKTVMVTCQNADEDRGKMIIGSTLVNIIAKFVKFYDMTGEAFFLKHLQY